MNIPRTADKYLRYRSMMKQKILHIQLLPLLSGAQNVMLTLLDGLDRNEFDIYVACRPGGPLVDAVLSRGFQYIALNSFRREICWNDAAVLLQLFRLIKKHKFDIIHTHSSKPGLLGRLAARFAGTPLIIHTGHGAPFNQWQPLPVRTFYQVLEKLGAGLGHKLVFVNNYHREFYLKKGLIAPAKAQTVFNALHPSLQQLLEAIPIRHRQRKGKVVIGSICRFTPAKNILAVIGAAITLCRLRKDVNFIIVGDGELMSLCRRMVTQSGFRKRINLPGWQAEPHLWLEDMDVFLLYSDYEGLPLSVIEAMFAGLPVIASDIPMLAELVNRETGWLVPARNQKKLVKIMHQVIDEQKTLELKGINARNRVRGLCSYQDFISSYLNIYRSVKDER